MNASTSSVRLDVKLSTLMVTSVVTLENVQSNCSSGRNDKTRGYQWRLVQSQAVVRSPLG